MKKKGLLFFLCLCLLHLTAYAQEVRVALCANMQHAKDDLARAFREQTGIDVSFSTGSSGALLTQIVNGAPFDVFLSADEEFVQSLCEKDLCACRPRVYAHGVLVIYSRDRDIGGITDLTGDSFRTIGIADPESAPYGRAAVAALTRAGILDAVSSKLVQANKISVVHSHAVTGAVDCGFCAGSIRSAVGDSGYICEVPHEFYEPIKQAMVVIAREGGAGPGARAFFDFMSGDTARGILLRHGYGAPEVTDE